MKLLLFLILSGIASAQCGANGSFFGVGNAGDFLCTGKVGGTGFSASFTGQTGITVTAVTHGQGTKPGSGGCWDNATPANFIPQTAGFPTVAANGDMVFAWTGSKTGYCLISALGNQIGPAGATGAAGAPGAAGATGATGPAGAAGAAGPTGATGAAGAAGAVGATGATGPAGVVGSGANTGIMCFQGGTSGQICVTVGDVAGTSVAYIQPSAAGTNGQVLSVGTSTACPTWPSPPAGVTWPTTCYPTSWITGGGGATGATGATGPAGAAGATGATGPAGATGATGPAGSGTASALPYPAWTAPIIPLAMSSTSVVTVANTNSATSMIGKTFTGSVVLPPGNWTGSTWEIKMGGLYSTTGLTTISMLVVLGGQTIGTMAPTLGTSASGLGWELLFRFTPLTMTSVNGSGCARAVGAAQAVLVACSGSATTGLDFSTSQTLDVTATWSAASSSNTITAYNALVRRY